MNALDDRTRRRAIHEVRRQINNAKWRTELLAGVWDAKALNRKQRIQLAIIGLLDWCDWALLEHRWHRVCLWLGLHDWWYSER